VLNVFYHRKTTIGKHHSLRIAWIAALLLTAGGCAHRSAGTRAYPEIFWPKPPETKRIAFVNAVSKPKDLNIHPGIFKKVVDYMVGGTESTIVSPYGISTDYRNRIYVVDTYLKQVHVFDPQGNRYDSFPADRTLLVSPVGIDVDQTGRIYLTDSKAKVVHIFSDYGKTYVTGFGRGIFKRPTGIAVNPKTSELLVVDTLQSRIFRFELSGLKLKGSFGGNGIAEGRFHYPTHIAVTPSGNIIVSDSLNFRVQLFSPEGGFLKTLGSMGHNPGTFSRPKGVASDSDGHIYVVDALFDNIQVFDSDGGLLMAFGEHGNGVGAFWLPTGIHIDHKDSIYVSDSANQRIQVFQYLKKDAAK